MRLYYTLAGASEPFRKLGLGDPRGPRNNVDLAFLAPDGRNIDVRTLKVVEGTSRDGLWIRDIVATEKNQAGDGKEIVEETVKRMKELVRLHPGRSETNGVPWQASLGHGVFVSAWDSQLARCGGPREPRRIVLAAAPGGRVDPDLESVLEDPGVLGRFERHYVFVRLDPREAPAEFADALDQAGPRGLVLLDLARSVDGFGQSQDGALRTYPKTLLTRAGPLAKAAVMDLLARHVAPRETARPEPRR